MRYFQCVKCFKSLDLENEAIEDIPACCGAQMREIKTTGHPESLYEYLKGIEE